MNLRVRVWLAAAIIVLAGEAVALAEQGMHVWVAPDTCKVNPRNGNVLEEHSFWRDPSIPPPDYVKRKMDKPQPLPYFVNDMYDGPITGLLREENPVWDSNTRTVKLQAGRNEFAAFQMIVESTGDEPLQGVAVEVADLKGPAPFDTGKSVQVLREYYMKAARNVKDSDKMTGPIGPEFWYPEFVVPASLKGQMPFDVPDPKMKLDGQRNQAIWVDVYVPHSQRPGTYTGRVRVTAAKAKPADVTLVLEVLPLELPDKVTFKVDMMGTARPIAEHWGLGLRKPDAYKRYLELEGKFYGIFEEHRCTLNMFPGSPSRADRTPEEVVLRGFAPKIQGQGKDIHVADWSEYDAHFDPYFSGKAFADLPRGAQPVTHQFLPFSLGWPSRFSQYNDDRETYKVEFQTILKQFAEHFEKKGWTQTEFQIFFNGKRKFGEAWDTDEPTKKDDYAALRMYGEWIRQALGDPARRKAKILYRLDIGTPQKMEGELDEVVDLRNVNYEAYNEFGYFWSDFRKAQEKKGETWWYYAEDRANERWVRTDFPMATSYLWAWAMWDLKVRGCCKWDCLNWNREDPLRTPGMQWSYCAYVYPGDSLGYDGPLATLRLKALRRGLQDMEYLAQLAAKDGNTKRADAVLQKYYTAWDRKTGKPLPPGSVKVGPLESYYLRAQVVHSLLEAPDTRKSGESR